jgi:hypothetical integral membrane protein (TIGR02206 family)
MNLTDYFSVNYPGAPFTLFDSIHLTALAVIAIFNIFVIWRYRNAPEPARIKIRWAMAGVLWANEIGWHIWHLATDQWTTQTMLPLHLCSVLVWTGALALITKNYRIYEFLYFMGIAGAIQPLLTPDVGAYGFPHYKAFQTFISHGLIISAAFYMTIVEGFRPTWKSFWRVLIGMNLYMAVVFVINQLIGSNYLFLARKLETASLLDVLPEWPWYILYIEALGIILCLLLYIPYAIKDWRAARAEAR